MDEDCSLLHIGGSTYMKVPSDLVKKFKLNKKKGVKVKRNEENGSLDIYFPKGSITKVDTLLLKDKQFILGLVSSGGIVNLDDLYSQFKRTYRNSIAKPRFQKAIQSLIVEGFCMQLDIGFWFDGKAIKNGL